MEQEGRPAEIGQHEDNLELAALAGDFIDGHGGRLGVFCLEEGRLKEGVLCFRRLDVRC